MYTCCLVALLFTLGLASAIPAKEYHIEPRIVGGSEAKPHQFPYLVTLQKPNDVVDATICGGTILSERWILTAAECFNDIKINDFIIMAGKHDLSVEKEEGQQIRKAEKIIKHKGFNVDVPGPDDIALIYLSEPLEFSETVSAVNLPKADVVPTGDAVIAGWGSTSYSIYYEYPGRVQFGTVKILDNQTCKSKLEGVNFNESNLCSSSYLNKIGHCSGDAGGPLLQESTIVGVISYFFRPCGQAYEAPPAFVRVSYYISWINENMK